MKAFWKFTTFLLTGLILGLILSDKLAMGVNTIFKGAVRIKQKGGGNVLDVDIKPEIVRDSRKLARILEKLERQRSRAQKKITKQHKKEMVRER